ncbi:GNAT family N-acetyltransferase [Kitasatospora sp. A2-31]|uniref:GNAT family N-acetyltransferase n=1 Tax=Kitasatospora sp. A2-31 TaxID=2916414 RepID=UPI001EEC42FC|nr:GNAT family N-acetyltransferase [Kitasatospora sp. A2-31]MCG6497964.1 GNAT family N-acetyltransferase [Kitasatospora sp. A2-31]
MVAATVRARPAGGAAARPVRYRSPALPVDVLDGWRSLATADPAGSWFTTPEWALSWWETLGTQRGTGEITVWREADGRVSAVVPLLHTRRRLHPRVPLAVPCLTVLGSGPGAADHCGFTAAPERRGEVADWLRRRGRRATLLLTDLDPGQTGLLPPGAVETGRTPCPRADLTAGPDALGSRRFRANLRRYGRKLATEGITFRWVGPAVREVEIAERKALLDAVLRLHRQRRAALGRPTTFDAVRAPLHLRLIERAAATGRGEGPAFLVAERAGEAVGVLYGFLWRDAFAYYQIGWDQTWAPLRLGTAVIAEAVRAAADQGLATFDFLRGTEPYKYRFDAVDREDVSWLVPHGLSGALLGLKHRAKAARRG